MGGKEESETFLGAVEKGEETLNFSKISFAPKTVQVLLLGLKKKKKGLGDLQIPKR